MKKEITIEGMSCGHCVKRVESALNELEGVAQVVVKLEENKAVVELSSDVTDEVLIEVIDDAGYDVVSIRNI
jgi:copper ion binding protein